MNRFPSKLNIVQLSERSGFSVSRIDLLIQDGLVSGPVNGFMFSSMHEQELESIKTLEEYGCNIEHGRRTDYVIDMFAVS